MGLTPDQRRLIAEFLEKDTRRTQGEWLYKRSYTQGAAPRSALVVLGQKGSDEAFAVSDDNAAFIAACSGVAELLRAVVAENERLTKENAHLRAALANSKDPCVYCQLPAERMAECRSGFPGCARADDMQGCPEFGAAMELHCVNEELASLRLYKEAWKAVEKIVTDAPTITFYEYVDSHAACCMADTLAAVRTAMQRMKEQN